MKRINLSDLKKQDPFQVPEGYLENLPQMIQQKLTHKPDHYWQGWSSLITMPRVLPAFFLLLFIISAVVFFNRNTNSEAPAAQAILEATPEQEIVTYLTASEYVSLQELTENEVDHDLYAVELTAEDALENEIMLNIESYTSEELWK